MLVNVFPTPGPATRLIVLDKNTTEVTLSWTPPTVVVPPARYRVRYRPLGTQAWIMHPVVTTVNKMTVDELAPATTYEFEVLTDNGH